MSVEVKYEHIVIGENKVPMISGTSMKVVELIEEKMAFGWSPEELHFQHPYLTMGQIHSALAYYWDHTDEIHQEIERRLRYSDQMRQAAGPSPFLNRLKEQGLL